MKKTEFKTNPQKLGIVFLLNFLFALIELIGGLFTNSIAILSNALHDFGDSLSIGIAFFMESVAGRRRDKRFSYGYGRFSLLSALINGIVLTCGSIFIIYNAIIRIITPSDINYIGMFYIAVFGLIVNSAAYFILHKGHSLNEKVISLHLLEDVLGWGSVLIISIIMMRYYIPVIDPIFSIAYTLFILYKVAILVKKTLKLFLQGIPYNCDYLNIIKEIKKVSGIVDVHDFHLWSLDGINNIASLHIVVEENIKLENIPLIKEKVRGVLKNFNITHTTVEVDLNCEKCTFDEC